MALTVDPLSLVTVKITAITKAGKRNPASGFLIKSNDVLYLVTNLHVLIARDPSNRSISKNGESVKELEIEFNFSADGKSIRISKGEVCSLPIIDELEIEGIWLEHSDPTVDVALVPIKAPDNAFFRVLDQVEFDQVYKPSIGDEVFVVGYPRNLTAGSATLPLWKGGSIASEPIFDILNKPILLIDSDTYEGMSGSPVIAQHHGYYGNKSEIDDSSIIGTLRKFIGIYSGRVKYEKASEQNQDRESQLAATKFGFVWKAKIIEEILAKPERGKLVR